LTQARVAQQPKPFHQDNRPRFEQDRLGLPGMRRKVVPWQGGRLATLDQPERPDKQWPLNRSGVIEIHPAPLS
jgi:hypothetical protein